MADLYTGLGAYFDNAVGVALVRQNHATGEWDFVQWCNGNCDFVVDTPGVGSFGYALCAVIGHGASSTSITYSGLVQLAVQNVKK
jgi:hypothetical protein